MATKLVSQDGTPVKYQGKEVFSTDYLGVVKSVDTSKRTLIMSGTDETKDRDGDIIRLSGWNLDNYKKNPVFLWAHNYGSVPIARAEKVTKKKEPPRMEFLLQFPTKGIYPFADMILELYDEKIINASSVGFIPTKWNSIEEDNKDGDNRVSYGREYVNQELLELSGCAVPSNPSAVQSALKGKNFGFKDDDLLKYLTGATLIPRPEKEDDIVDELYKSETEIIDETIIQVQVADNLLPSNENLVGIINPESGHIDTVINIPLEDPEKIGGEEISASYPNEHYCQLVDPSSFDKVIRRDCLRKVKDKCIDYVFGVKDNKIKGTQSLRFNKSVWSADDAKVICDSAKGKFEAAAPPKSPDDLILNDSGTMSMEITGAKDLPVNSDPSWDGSAAVDRMRELCGGPDKTNMDWEKYGKGFVVMDKSNKENFGSYKLPFADVRGGHLTAVWGGVMRAMNSVHGGRGGIIMSDADKKAAHDFLAGYYKKLDKPVPQLNSIFDLEKFGIDFPEELDIIRSEEESAVDEQMKEMIKKMFEMMGTMKGSIEKMGGMPDIMANIDKSMTEMMKMMETLVNSGKGIQDSLVKALEETQRIPKVVHGTSASILQDAFNQGKTKVDSPPTEKYSKESLSSLRLALVEVAKAMKKINF